MPSPRLQRAVTDASAGAANAEFAASDSATGIVPGALAVALLVACLYAAFAHGAVASAAEERLQLGLAVIALAGAVAWSRRRLSLRAPGRLWLAVGLLAAFAFWSGVTVLWSVAPDRTWTECNRVMTYVLVLVLAIAVGASLKNVPTRIADGLALVSLAVAAERAGSEARPGSPRERRSSASIRPGRCRGSRSRSATGTRWRCWWRSGSPARWRSSSTGAAPTGSASPPRPRRRR